MFCAANFKLSHCRNFFQLDFETVEEFLVRSVRVEVHVGVRMPIAGEKIAESQRLGGVAGTHQDEVALAAPDQLEAAENEGPHEDFAEFGVSSDERPQAIPGEFEKFTRLGDAAAHQATPAGNHGHLAGEFAWVVLGNGALAREVGLHDLHFAGEQNKKRDIGVVGFKQDFALFHGPQLADGPNSADLGIRQDRERLRARVERAGY